MSEKSRVSAWAMIYPDGRVLVDTSLKTPDDTWMVGLGWPDQAEIEAAKKRGYKVIRVRVTEL